MTRHAHAMPFGAALQPGGGAAFRLWAPAAKQVALLLHEDGIAARDAEAVGDGWYELRLSAARAGLRYQWRIDGELAVPDPASRFNPEGPQGASELIDPEAFAWPDSAWHGRPWHETVFYQLHVGTFTSEGSYAAAAKRLPALAAMGFTAVQLMPLADFPGRFGWGYDGVLPFAPFHGYGRPDELKAFVAAAHAAGLMVFGDVVYNHFGPDGNYLHAYAPQFFSERYRNPWGAAINYDDDTVREFFIANALYWLDEFRFDGLRLDAVHAIRDDRRPDILQTLAARVRRHFEGRHVHLVLENDSNDRSRLEGDIRFAGQWNGDVHHCLHVLLTGEHDGYYGAYRQPMQQLAQALTRGFAYEGEPGTPARGPAQGSAPLLAVVNLLQCHDQVGNRAFGERLLALAEPAAVRLAAAIVLLSPTVPLVFMGEEQGSVQPFSYFADWHGELADAVRRGRRDEFAHFERYAEAARDDRLPDPCSEDTFRRSKLEPAAGRAWPAFYAELLALRRRELVPHLPALPVGGHEARVEGRCLRVAWRWPDRTLVMQVNLSADAVALWNGEGEGDPWFALNDGGAWSGAWWWAEGGP